MRTLPGNPAPLGATPDSDGTNFAFFSEHAEGIELCFYAPDNSETGRVTIDNCLHSVWCTRVPDVRPGQRYGIRVHGPWKPEDGLRFNPAKLLLDPYARLITGTGQWNDTWMGHAGDDDLVRDDRDSAPTVPRSVVIDPAFDWNGDAPPRVPWKDTVIYELHVKGFTKRHPDVPEELRGTYAGLASPAAIDHLRKLGITAVELMPVHHEIPEPFLTGRGLTNYWGYNTIGYFAPDTRFNSQCEPQQQVAEFKGMVKALHAAGLEVILDVVYNHTAEGNHLGPTLCFRGLDNDAYYRLVEGDRRHYMDYTGCGNTLNMDHPRTLQLIMDSLRYWITEMHVDGFRFDLASALARELNDVNMLGPFFETILQDPVVSRTKLIAEPWDVGEGGYQVGNFPELWAEWNGIYRDTVRSFWKGDEGQAGSFAYRLTGSSDLYGKGGRRPYASVNFVTAHDGFTLRDLVSYNEKHNEANGENNADGNPHNLSWNCGAEGPTDDAAVDALRARQQRNFLATLLLSLGVPMLCHGDELGRTQQGNNNAYCQDNPITWIDWNLDQERTGLLEFTRRVLDLRRRHPALRRDQFPQGRRLRGSEVKDLAWFRPDGREMSEEDWATYTRCLGVRFAGDALTERARDGTLVQDDTLLMLVNAWHEPIKFVLPAHKKGLHWQVELDTCIDHAAALSGDEKDQDAGGEILRGGATYDLEERSFVLLSLIDGADGGRRP